MSRRCVRALARHALANACASVERAAPPWRTASICRVSSRASALATRSRGASTIPASDLLTERERERIASDLRAMATRKMDSDGAHGRRVALVPLGTYNDDPCVVMTVSEDGMRGGQTCALPSAAVEEDTLLESASVATTSAARRAEKALFGTSSEGSRGGRGDFLGASHDVADVKGRTIVTPVLAYLGEIADLVRGRSDVAAISLSTLMSLEGVAADPKGDGVRFVGTLSARGLEGYEAQVLHNALRVVAGPNRAYKEALYDQFVPGYVRQSPPAPPSPYAKTDGHDRAMG